MSFSLKKDLGQKFSWMIKERGASVRNTHYDVAGGQTDVRMLTLDYLYYEHTHFRNVWTRSNEGYDLARYIGTVFKLPPHPHIPYIFWWDRNWDETEVHRLNDMHPASLILQKKHVTVFPRSYGNKRTRRIFVPPPTRTTSQWFPMDSWCGVGVLQFGISPINLEDPFVHGQRITYGTTIGYAQDNQTTPPIPIWWSKSSLEGLFNVEVCYRWWWDDGKDNYIMVNTKNIDPTTSGSPPTNPESNYKMISCGMPYWKYFWGMCNISYKKQYTDATTQNINYVAGKNPYVYALTWYRDAVLKTSDGGWTTDPLIRGPQDCKPPNQKVWVFLSNKKADNLGTESNYPSADTVKSILTMMTCTGPFAFWEGDIPWGRNNVNFPILYSSIWQWGGHVPKPDNIQDPCKSPDPRTQVRDPSSAGLAVLHPWDLDKQGLITKQALQRLLSGLSTPPLTGRQVPEQVPEDELQPKFPVVEGWPVPEEERPSSEESTPTSSETETEESQEDEDPPLPSPREIRRLLRHQRRDGNKYRKLKRLLYKLTT